MKQRTYGVGKCTLTLEFGDLTSSTAEALVSSDDSFITMGGGVSAAILRAGGESILRDAAKKVPAEPGTVVVTTAGSLRAKYVFHAITLGRSELSPSEIVTRTTARSIELLEMLGLSSIAFPAIGTGVAGFSYEDVASRMAAVLVDALKDCARAVAVTIYLFDRYRRMQPIDYLDFFEQFAVRTKNLPLLARPLGPSTKPRVRRAPPTNVDEASGNAALPADQEQRRQSIVNLGDLDSERQALEARLAEYQGVMTKGEVNKIEKRLLEVHHQRVELLTSVKAKPSTAAVDIFVSYSHADEKLRVELGKHLSVLQRQGLISAWNDRMITAGSEWAGAIDDKLNESRIILLLISSDFVHSKYCYDIELQRAMERHERREALVVPVMLRPVLLAGTPFAKLQALPKDARPATEWPSLDAAFVSVTEGLRDALQCLDALQPPKQMTANITRASNAAIDDQDSGTSN
jgi:O-acetyl-ADP-ribose deacetylase (regulator of RNase III)